MVSCKSGLKVTQVQDFKGAVIMKEMGSFPRRLKRVRLSLSALTVAFMASGCAVPMSHMHVPPPSLVGAGISTPLGGLGAGLGSPFGVVGGGLAMPAAASSVLIPQPPEVIPQPPLVVQRPPLVMPSAPMGMMAAPMVAPPMVVQPMAMRPMLVPSQPLPQSVPDVANPGGVGGPPPGITPSSFPLAGNYPMLGR